LRDPDLVLPTIISGLTVYFDRSLGANLLYRFERPQYAEMRKAYVTGPKVQVGQEKDMSSIYGAEHLLRMLGMFSTVFDWIAWRGFLTDCSSEFATDGGRLDDGWGEHRVGERLCERAALVRACLSLSCPHRLAQKEHRFLVTERDRLFLPEYQSASLQYQNISRS